MRFGCGGISCVSFRLFFFERTRPAASMRPAWLIFLSTSKSTFFVRGTTGALPKHNQKRSSIPRFHEFQKKHKSAEDRPFLVLSQYTVQSARYSSFRVVISVFGVLNPVKTRRNRGAAHSQHSTPQQHQQPKHTISTMADHVHHWGQLAAQ